MWTGGIRIPVNETRVVIREAPFRITYPRTARLVAGAVLLATGLGFWAYLTPPDGWTEPLEYALGLLMGSPGLAVTSVALRRRPVVDVWEGTLRVRYGPLGLERAAASFPLDAAEVRVTSRTAHATRYDGGVLWTRLASVILPLRRTKLQEREVALYVLELRCRGQEEWLGVLGSQVRSEIENARLTIVRVIPERDEGLTAEIAGDAEEKNSHG